MKRLRPEEEWVRAMMSAALGVPVEQHDDNSKPSMHDLTVRYRVRPDAAVEVTSAAAADCIELWNLMNGRAGRWQIEGLRGGWVVTVLPSARDKDLRSRLPTLLSRLESAGIRELEPSFTHLGPLAALAEELGVVDALQSPTTSFPGSVYRTIEEPLERRGGYVSETGDALASWIAEFLKTPESDDVRRKLAHSGAVERHAFVLLPGFTTAPFSVSDLLMRDDAPLPSIPPVLPPEVTHVWVASTWAAGSGLRWCPRSACWMRFGKGQRDQR